MFQYLNDVQRSKVPSPLLWLDFYIIQPLRLDIAIYLLGFYLWLVPLFGLLWWLQVDWPWWVAAFFAVAAAGYRYKWAKLSKDYTQLQDDYDARGAAMQDQRWNSKERIKTLNAKLPPEERDIEDALNLEKRKSKTIRISRTTD